jgi:hypothetical protein
LLDARLAAALQGRAYAAAGHGYRHAFRPLSAEIVALLRSLSADDWKRPTVAGSWRVRDVVAHLLDTALRRLSFHRDRSIPPADTGAGSLVDLINDPIGPVHAARRLSPRALTDLYAHAASNSPTSSSR